MGSTFSKGQRVHGEYRGAFYKGVITNVTARDTDMVVSVKLDREIVVKGEPMPREKFMTAVNENGDFTASVYQGYMALVSEDIQPADVDRGGDFEGFVNEVNAEPTPAQESAWYTEPVTSADGEQIKARVTTTEAGHVVEVLANGMVIADQTETHYFRGLAIDAAQSKAIAYMLECNRARAVEMGDETETIYPPLTDKAARKTQLTAHIERLKRELEGYEYELAQLNETEKFVRALSWLAERQNGADSDVFKIGAGIDRDTVAALRKQGFIERFDYEWTVGAIFQITDMGRDYLKAQDN